MKDHLYIHNLSMYTQIICLITLLYSNISFAQFRNNDIAYEFTKILLPKPNVINHIGIDSVTQKIWLGTNQALYYLDTLNHFNTIDIKKTFMPQINCMAIPKKSDFIWIGTYDGMRKYNKKNRIIRIDFSKRIKDNSKSQELVTAIAAHEADVYWGTSQGNIFRYQSQKDEVSIMKSPTVSNIKSLCINQNGKILVCTSEGLYLREKILSFPFWKKITSLNHIDDKVAIDNTIQKIIYEESNKDVFWVLGKDHNGSAQLLEINNKDIIKQKLCIPVGPNIVFSDFDFDDEGRIWITTNKGLIVYSKIPYACSWFPFELEKETGLKSITINNKQTAWIGVEGSSDFLYKFHLPRQKSCGLYGQKIHTIFFEKNKDKFEDKITARMLIFKICKYLKDIPNHRIQLVYRSKHQNSRNKRFEKIEAIFKEFGYPTSSIHRIETSDQVTTARAINIEFICPDLDHK